MNTRLFTYMLLITALFTGTWHCKTPNTAFNTAKHSRIKDFEVDELGNIYTVDKDNQLTKYDVSGNIKYHYTNYTTGDLSAVDVTNPHKIMLFYKDFQQIIILDNTLSEMSNIRLSPQWLIIAAGYANDGNFWLFDITTMKFLKIDNKGNVINESLTAKEITSDSISGSKVYDRDNYMYVVLRDKKIMLYDNRTYFIRALDLGSVAKPVIIKGIIYYFSPKANSIMAYNLKYNENYTVFDFDKENIKADMAILQQDKIYFSANDKEYNYPKKGGIYIINIKK